MPVFAFAAAAALPFDPHAAAQAWLATMGPEAAARSNAYFEGGYIIGPIQALASIAAAAVILMLGWGRGARAFFERTVKWFPLVAFGTSAFVIFVSSLLTFPLVYYVSFVRERRYELLTQTFPEWMSEHVIGAALGIVLGALFFTVLYLVMRIAKSTWWIWGSGVAIVFAAVLVMVAPVYIAPMFNTYEEMEQGALRDSILAMAQAHGVPADNVYVFDHSRQSNTITANVSGLMGTTRISLADTLIERTSPQAVRAVMGHEIGHYVLGHIYSIMVMAIGVIIITFAGVHYGFRAIARNERWGVRDISDPAGLPLVMALLALIGVFTTPLQNNMTRFHENQADAFGLAVAREPDGFAEAAVLLSEYRKMQPSALEEALFYTHPSGWSRVYRAMRWKAHEIAAGRLEPSPGGPPEGWVPDFARDREAPAPSPEPSPAAESD